MSTAWEVGIGIVVVSFIIMAVCMRRAKPDPKERFRPTELKRYLSDDEETKQ